MDTANFQKSDRIAIARYAKQKLTHLELLNSKLVPQGGSQKSKVKMNTYKRFVDLEWVAYLCRVVLDILRYQTRLLLEFNLIKIERYKYAEKLLNDIGNDLGGWIKQQKIKTNIPVD
ncbi:four helix bundle protein [Nostoc flagelliforme]|uniref:four helix bundle protein n=1 Tax=Nostoc flagelliforme TaxID=1306274 RepID=UPI001F556D5D|nr:four helix bundle protein [Nostoc flagelliforme]